MYLLHMYVCACVSASVYKVLKRASDALELGPQETVYHLTGVLGHVW